MKKYILIFSSVLFFLSGCTDHFNDLNTDSKNPAIVPAEPLFANATRNLFDLMSDCNVNRNVFRLYGQYWSQTTYPDESQYNMVGRDIPGSMWDILYRDVLKDLKEAKTIVEAEEPVNSEDPIIFANKMATIDILEAFTYTTLVDIFGDVPYSEALDIENVNPAYDGAKAVYDASIDKLNNALKVINTSEVGFGAGSDLIYEGDLASWVTLGNSLKLKLAMRYADVDMAKATTMVNEAKGDLILAAEQDFALDYYGSAPNTNPLWDNLVNSGRNDFLPANTIVNIMQPRLYDYLVDTNEDEVIDDMDDLVVVPGSADFTDPRAASYFDANLDFDTSLAYVVYEGGVYGTANAYSGYTHLSDNLKDPNLPGTLLGHVEVHFLLAEAAARGIDVGGTAKEYYDAAITASMNEAGINSGIATYLDSPSVNYDTTSGDWKAKIGKQKWIAMFNNGFEGWTTWRLFDLDFILAPAGLEIPTRLIYPIDEATLNGANYDKAASNYNGDSATAKIFWDVN